MTILAASPQTDILSNPALCAAFPHLTRAMDPEAMANELGSALLLQGSEDVVAIGRPRAEIDGDVCWLQYPLRVRGDQGGEQEITVLGAMFAHPSDAIRFEREALAPVAARAAGPLASTPRSGVIEPLGLALSVFPVHGALPTLVDAVDPQRVAALLRRARNRRPRVRAVELVTLRRNRGCVLRYHLDAAEHPVVYGKVGDTAVGQRLHRALNALQREGSARRRPVNLPRVLGHDESLELTILSAVPGVRPDLESLDGRDLAVAAGASIAASLHSSSVRTGHIRRFRDEWERASAAARAVSNYDQMLGDNLQRILDAVLRIDERRPALEVSLSHGSFAPSQLVVDGQRVGVLDFDRVCDAEPGFDLGRFLAPLRVTLAKHGVAADDLAAQFVSRYRQAGGSPHIGDRYALHEVVALVRMTARSWLQLKQSRLNAVEQVLASQVSALGLAG